MSFYHNISAQFLHHVKKHVNTCVPSKGKKSYIMKLAGEIKIKTHITPTPPPLIPALLSREVERARVHDLCLLSGSWRVGHWPCILVGGRWVWFHWIRPVAWWCWDAGAASGVGPRPGRLRSSPRPFSGSWWRCLGNCANELEE